MDQFSRDHFVDANLVAEVIFGRISIGKKSRALLRLVSWGHSLAARLFWVDPNLQVPGSPARVQDDGAHTSENF